MSMRLRSDALGRETMHTVSEPSVGQRDAITADELAALDLYWRAANFLGAAQIYLRDNVLLEEPLRPEQIKPRLLGHWGTVPGINFLDAHLDRMIRAYDASLLLVTGPGHGAPANPANLFLEGSLGEFYPELARDRAGLERLVRGFSWPDGFPSHLDPGPPGTIHGGGELGYALATAFGAALDNPDLIVACIVGDGEAETGPTATAWHGTMYLNPASDGAVAMIIMNETSALDRVARPGQRNNTLGEAMPGSMTRSRERQIISEGRTIMKINDIMTSDPECIRPDTTLQEAARKMRDLDVGPLPVCGDGNRPIGMITDRDITVRAVAEGRDPKTTPVREAMTEEIVAVFEDQDVAEAARLMEERQIRRLLVLDRDNRLVGIISLGDLAVESGDRAKAGEVLQEVSEPAFPHR